MAQFFLDIGPSIQMHPTYINELRRIKSHILALVALCAALEFRFSSLGRPGCLSRRPAEHLMKNAQSTKKFIKGVYYKQRYKKQRNAIGTVSLALTIGEISRLFTSKEAASQCAHK